MNILSELNKFSFFIAPIFYKLVYLSITSVLIGVVLLIIRRIADKKISPNWKYIMWICFIVSLILPIRFQSNYSAIGFIDSQQIQEFSYREEYDRIRNEEHLQINANASEQNTDYVISQIRFLTQINQIRKELYVKSLIFDVIIPMVWFFGTLIFMLFMLISVLRLNKKIKQTDFSTDMESISKRCKNIIKVNKNIKIVIQDYIKTPALFGLFKPVIILPRYCIQMEKENIEYIILHELAHYKRRDIQINYLFLILQAIYWFNPLTWVFFKFIRQDLELATDSYVLKFIDKQKHKQYSLSLVEVLKLYNKPTLAPKLLCMVDNKKNIERRIKMIKLNELFKRKNLIIGMTSFVLIGVISVLFLTTKAANTNETNPNEPPKIQITAAEEALEYFVLKNFWNGSYYDRPSAYQYAFKENPNMDGLITLDFGETISLDFGKYNPDSIDIMYEFLTPDGYGIENIASSYPSVEVKFIKENGKYIFEMDENAPSSLNSLEIVGRVYMVIVNWGGNQCEYAFTIKDNHSSTINYENSSQNPSQSTAKEVFEGYIQAMQSSDYVTIYHLTKKDLQSSMDLDIGQQIWNTIKIDDIRLIHDDVRENRACFQIEMDIYDGGESAFEKGTFPRWLYLVKEDDNWYAEGLMTGGEPTDEWWLGETEEYSIKTDYDLVNNLDGVSMEIKTGTLSETGMVLIIQNSNNNVCMFGSYYCIEKKINGMWYQIPYVIKDTVGWTSIGYPVGHGYVEEKLELEVNWEWLYGKLDAGEYRILKDTFIDNQFEDKYYITTEFIIE